VREALFGILAERLPEARVLDAYAGSGALGFEALSRGARHVTFVESDAEVARRLRRTAVELGVEADCEVLHGRVLDRLARGRVAGSFDLILADPPYSADETLEFLDRAVPWLAPDGLIVLERDLHAAPVRPPRGLAHRRTARYGTNCLEFFSVSRGDPHG